MLVGILMTSGACTAPDSNFKGNRYLTLNTVIRVNQIEVSRDRNVGVDERDVHTPERVVTFDTKATHTFSQISLQRRIGVVNALSGHFYVSKDGDSWEDVGTFVIADTDEPQLFSIIPTEGQFVKIEVTKTTNPDNTTAISEIHLYSISD